MNFDTQVDASGLNCPLPILRAKKALAEMNPGQVLRVLATDPGSVKAAFAEFTAARGAPYGLIHCVGDFAEQPLLATAADDYAALFRSNVDTVFHTVQAVVPAMVAARRGRVILFAAAGVDSHRAMLRAPVYFAAKAAVVQLARSLAGEVARHGITVNVVCPGPTDTALLSGFAAAAGNPEKLLEAFTRAIPLGRLGKPDDLAGAIAFLASDDAGFVTGQVLSVSGGLTMNG